MFVNSGIDVVRGYAPPQPALAAGESENAGLWRGLRFCVPCFCGRRDDLIRGIKATVNGSVDQRFGNAGIGYYFDGNSSFSYPKDSFYCDWSADFSIVVGFEATNQSNINVLFAAKNSGANAQDDGVSLSINSYNSNDRKLISEAANYRTNYSVRTNSGTVPINNCGTGALLRRGTQLISQYGSEKAELEVTGDFSPFKDVSLGSFSDKTFGMQGIIYSVAVYNRALLDTEINLLAADPFAMFRRKKIYKHFMSSKKTIFLPPMFLMR